MKNHVIVLGAVLIAASGCSKKDKKEAPAEGAPAAQTNTPPAPAATPVAAPAPAPAPAPRFPPGTGKGVATIGQGKREGSIPLSDLVKKLEEQIPAFEGCYEKGLAEKPGLKGNVQLAFVINDKGKVIKSFAQGIKHAGVEQCMADVVSTIEFRWPPDGKPVAGFLPVVVKPAGAK